MDKISEFLKDLKDRASSPFFSSFFLSWLIFNWRVLIVLFFYSKNDLIQQGHSSYINFIEENTTVTSNLISPTITAFLYTFLYPIFRNVVITFNSWVRSWGSRWSISVGKGTKVSVEKYIRLRETYEERTRILERVIADESETRNKYEEIKNELELTKIEKNKLDSEVRKWNDASQVNQLNGFWELKYISTNTVYRIDILNGVITWRDHRPNRGNNFQVRNFYRAPDTNQISLTTAEEIREKKVFHFFLLSAIDNTTSLKGWENDSLEVEFKKIR